MRDGAPAVKGRSATLAQVGAEPALGSHGLAPDRKRPYGIYAP